MLLSSVRHRGSCGNDEQIALHTWALEQLLQGDALKSESLNAQCGVSLIQALDALARYARIPALEDSPRDGHSLRAIPLVAHSQPQTLPNQLATSIPETFTAPIPFAAFIGLAHILLGGDREGFGSGEYLQRANQLCRRSDPLTTLPLIAVCCFRGALLEHLLQRLCDAECPLDEGSPENSVKLLLAEISKEQQAEHGGGSERVKFAEPVLPNKSFRCRTVTPLSFLVSCTELASVNLLLRLGVRIDSVCFQAFCPLIAYCRLPGKICFQ